jgi:serine/threonine protein kinase
MLAASMDAPVQVQVGRYTMYGKIAAGGMATVHFGRLLGGAGFSRTVAIKRLHPHLAGDPRFLATMIDEARVAARIHHPNVVPTLDVVAAGGELLVVMEYVRGESLGRLMNAESKRGGRVPLTIASAIALGALQGLHAAHVAVNDHGAPLGIVHRDVSPQNILVGVDGVARVIDFGVAKAAGRLQTTGEGVVKGKMPYMPPEQLGAEELTQAADVYAMAVVLWEMLTGRRLFTGENDVIVFGKVLAGAKEPPSHYVRDLPAGVDALVMAGLACDPAKRFASAKDMAERLVRLVPPALPMDVGAWVEEMASEALAQRAASLAEIESSSGMTVRAGAISGPAALAALGRDRDADDTVPRSRDRTPVQSDDVALFSSQTSSLSIETPRRSLAEMVRPHRGWLIAAAAVTCLVLVAGVVALARRGGASSGDPRATASQVSRPVATVPPSEHGASASPPAQPSPSIAATQRVLPSPGPSAPTSAVARVASPAAATEGPKANPSPPPPPPRPPPTKRPADNVQTSGF